MLVVFKILPTAFRTLYTIGLLETGTDGLDEKTTV
jgi:hypothetical protein